MGRGNDTEPKSSVLALRDRGNEISESPTLVFIEEELSDGSTLERHGYYDLDGQFVEHREDGMASSVMDSHRGIIELNWRKHGVLDRESRPCQIAVFLEHGAQLFWSSSGQDEDGFWLPTSISYYEDGGAKTMHFGPEDDCYVASHDFLGNDDGRLQYRNIEGSKSTMLEGIPDGFPTEMRDRSKGYKSWIAELESHGIFGF